MSSLKDTTERNSSIELLRILLICGVIILHYVADNGQLLSKASRETETINFYLIVFFNSVCICAVDTFIIISGYFSCKRSSVSIKKPIQLLIEVIIFQIVFSIGLRLLKGESISLSSVVYNAIPKNYYVTLYIALMIMSPFFNRFICMISRKQFTSLIIVLVVLFLVEPTMAEILEGIKGAQIYGISTIGILGAEWGYTIVTFICLYFIGAYIRLFGSLWKQQYNLLIYICSLIILFIWKLIEIRVGNSISAEHYMNPVLVVNAISLFLLFKKRELHSKAISFISRGCFTVFLIHAQMIEFMDVSQYLSRKPLIFAGIWLGSVLLIFVACDVVGIIYAWIEKAVFDSISRKKGFYTLSLDDDLKD